MPRESSQPSGIASDRREQNLDGHFTLQPRVAGAIHHAHAAFAKRIEDLERAQALTRRENCHQGVAILA